uniref:Reverse transcriptase zinc-binding domain-containing protein n=1 Tax=Fagus sylvatica TaxID=28930 RepID=A0A2N9EHY9_FAGSY
MIAQSSVSNTVIKLIQSSPPTWQSALLSNTLIFIVGSPILISGLSVSGIASAFLLGTLTWRAFGPPAFLLVAIYFVIGTGATKVKMAQKEAQGVAEKRKGRRGPSSVIGSSAAGCVCAFLSIFQVGGAAFSQLWKLGFVASFCTKLSDTVSSEIGKAYGKTTEVVMAVWDGKGGFLETGCDGENMDLWRGDGARIRFGDDVWCIDDPLKVAYLELFRIARVKDAFVADNFQCRGDSVHWEVTFSRLAQDWEMESFSSFFELLYSVTITGIGEDKSIWKAKVPPQVAFFSWTAALWRILTVDNLRRRRVIIVSWCCMCKADGEFVDPLLLYCVYAKELWDMVFAMFGIHWVMRGRVRDLFACWQGKMVRHLE